VELSKFLETPADDVSGRSTSLPRLSSVPASVNQSGRNTAFISPTRISRTTTPESFPMPSISGSKLRDISTPDVSSSPDAEFKSLKEYYDETKAKEHFPVIPVATVMDQGSTQHMNGSLDLIKKIGKIDNPVESLSGENKEYAHLFGIRLPTEYHTHSHSGNRLWSNGHCPLCTQGNIELHDQKREIREREEETDKEFLNLAIEVDSEDANYKKELAHDTLYKAIQVANYNKMRARETEKRRTREGAVKPMGDLFENRIKPPSRSGLNQENAKEVLQQIHQKKLDVQKQDAERVKQDQQLSSHFVQQFRKEVIMAERDRIDTQKEQRTSLDQQIQDKQRLASRKPASAKFENKHARDESQMFSSQMERAKKLYAEQLGILSKKRMYEAQIAEMQRKTYSDRLEIYKSRYESLIF
jgi:hypothetical protein